MTRGWSLYYSQIVGQGGGGVVPIKGYYLGNNEEKGREKMEKMEKIERKKVGAKQARKKIQRE